jgi:hypothetical protein
MFVWYNICMYLQSSIYFLSQLPSDAYWRQCHLSSRGLDVSRRKLLQVIRSTRNGPDTATIIQISKQWTWYRYNNTFDVFVMLWCCVELLIISELFLHFWQVLLEIRPVKLGCVCLLNYCGLKWASWAEFYIGWVYISEKHGLRNGLYL